MSKQINLDYDLLVKWYVKDNLSLLEISNKLHISTKCINRNLKKYKIPTKSPQNYKRTYQKPTITKDILQTLYIVNNMRIKQIAKLYHTDTLNITKLLMSYHIPIKINQYVSKDTAIPLYIPKKRLLKLYIDKKLSTHGISKLYNTTHSVILRLFKAYNIKARPYTCPTIQPEVLHDLYIDRQLNSTIIANIYHCSPQVILDMLHKYNITPRTVAESRKLQCSNVEFKMKMLKSMSKNRHIKPNKVEQTLQTILDSLYPNQWKYVGNRKLFVGTYNPDFIHNNDVHKIIELFGDYWHSISDEQNKVDYYKNLGYETLIIWEHELKQLNSLHTKVKLFMEGTHE